MTEKEINTIVFSIDYLLFSNGGDWDNFPEYIEDFMSTIKSDIYLVEMGELLEKYPELFNIALRSSWETWEKSWEEEE